MTALYVLTDVSGSTVRDGFHAAWVASLPRIVELAERTPGRLRLCLVEYATTAWVSQRLAPPASIVELSARPPGGLSSLASGLRALADAAMLDRVQAAADGDAAEDVTVVVLMDDLPTDPAPAVLAARAHLREVLLDRPGNVHVALPGGAEHMAAAALDAVVHDLVGTDPPELAHAMVAVVGRALTPLTPPG